MFSPIFLIIALAVTLLLQATPTPVEVPKMTANLLISLTGAALSILAYVLPPLRRLQEKAGDWTPAIMAGALLLVAIAYQVVWYQYNLSLVLANWQGILTVWGLAVATNYGAYKAAIKPHKDQLEKVRISEQIDDEMIWSEVTRE